MDTAIIRQGELMGQGIMAYETTEEVGRVAHLLVEMKAAKVVGLVYKVPGLMGRKQALDWDQLVKIGGDRIVIQTEVPEAVESQLSAGQDITDLEVWTDGGDHIGCVVDVCFDQRTGKVQQYLFALKEKEKVANDEQLVDDDADDELIAELFGEETEDARSKDKTTVFVILPQAIISAGRKRMMIAEEDAQRAQQYDHPLDLAALSEAGLVNGPGNLSEQLPAMPTDLNELLHKGQSLAGQVAGRVKQTAKKLTDEQFADRELGEAGTLPEITQQLQEKTDQVRQQMQERLEKAKARAQEQLEQSDLEERLDKTLGKTAFGRSLGKSLNKQLDRFKRPQPPTEPIDVESFEVWEDD
ncbi:MAG: PRC-barrel domain-containing protein [Cyanobacteria bacterium J06581_3]